MKYLEEVLAKLEKLDLHVYEIDEYTPIPLAHKYGVNTHFIMKGSDIVHVGNLETIERWVMSLKEDVKCTK